MSKVKCSMSKVKAMSKSELADRAGVSLNTLNKWCKPFLQDLEQLGLQPRDRLLSPAVVRFIPISYA